MTSHLQNLQEKYENKTQLQSESPQDAQHRKDKITEHKTQLSAPSDLTKHSAHTDLLRKLPSTGLRMLTSGGEALYKTWREKNPWHAFKWLGDWAHILLDPPLIKEQVYTDYLAAIFKSTGDISSSFIDPSTVYAPLTPLPKPDLNPLVQYTRETYSTYNKASPGAPGIYNALPSYIRVYNMGKYEITDRNKKRREEIYIPAAPMKTFDESGTQWYTFTIDGDVVPDLLSLAKQLKQTNQITLALCDALIQEQESKKNPDRDVIVDAKNKRKACLDSKSYKTLRLTTYILCQLVYSYADGSDLANLLLEKLRANGNSGKKFMNMPDPTERISFIGCDVLPISKQKYYDISLPLDLYQMLDPKETSLLSAKALKLMERGLIRRIRQTIIRPPEYDIKKLSTGNSPSHTPSDKEPSIAQKTTKSGFTEITLGDSTPPKNTPDSSHHSDKEQEDTKSKVLLPQTLDMRGYGWKVLRSMVPTDAPKKLDGSYVEAGAKFEHEEETPGLSAAFSLITTPVSSNQNVTVRETRYSKLTLSYWARRVESERGTTRMALTLYKILMYLTQFQRHYVRPSSCNEAIFAIDREWTDWYEEGLEEKTLFPLSPTPIRVNINDLPYWEFYACTIGTYLQWITGERRDEGPIRSHIPVFLTKRSCNSYWDVWARIMLACPFPFLEFSWVGEFHQLQPFERNVEFSPEQKKYQHMWQKISIDGKFSPNIIFIVADAVDDEDSAVHITDNVTVGTVANAPGLIPPNPVSIQVPLNIPFELLNRTHTAKRTWSTLFREFADIADPRDIQLAVNAYKATSNVCLHVDNIYRYNGAVVSKASSCDFHYREDPGGPWSPSKYYSNVPPQVIFDHHCLSTLPPGYGINTYQQIITSQRPVLELPESSDLKIAMRMVQMTGPTSKMSIGDAFLEKLLIPEISFFINAALITEFEKFVVSNGVHMADVSFSQFLYHNQRFIHFTGLEPHILDRMRLLWECDFIKYAGKPTALTWWDRGSTSLLQQPGKNLTCLRRSHLPWFDRLNQTNIVRKYRRNWNRTYYDTILYNKTERGLWSEMEAFDTYIRRSIDPSFSPGNESQIAEVTTTDPGGESTTIYLPVVTAFPVRHWLLTQYIFAEIEEISGQYTNVHNAYWPDTLTDRYNPFYKGDIDKLILSYRSPTSLICNPNSSNNAFYRQFRNYGLSEVPEVVGDKTEEPVELLVS